MQACNNLSDRLRTYSTMAAEGWADADEYIPPDADDTPVEYGLPVEEVHVIIIVVVAVRSNSRVSNKKLKMCGAYASPSFPLASFSRNSRFRHSVNQ